MSDTKRWLYATSRDGNSTLGVGLALVFVFFRNRPPTPPSYGVVKIDRSSIFKKWRALLRNRDFNILLFCVWHRSCSVQLDRDTVGSVPETVWIQLG